MTPPYERHILKVALVTVVNAPGEVILVAIPRALVATAGEAKVIVPLANVVVMV